MVTTFVLVFAAWVLMVPAVLALARLLGRLSTPAAEIEAVAPPKAVESENVVALVPRPQNRLDPAARRAA